MADHGVVLVQARQAVKSLRAAARRAERALAEAEAQADADALGTYRLAPGEEPGQDLIDFVSVTAAQQPGAAIAVIVIALRGLDQEEVQ
jgi:hypothetical protein